MCQTWPKGHFMAHCSILRYTLLLTAMYSSKQQQHHLDSMTGSKCVTIVRHEKVIYAADNFDNIFLWRYYYYCPSYKILQLALYSRATRYDVHVRIAAAAECFCKQRFMLFKAFWKCSIFEICYCLGDSLGGRYHFGTDFFMNVIYPENQKSYPTIPFVCTTP